MRIGKLWKKYGIDEIALMTRNNGRRTDGTFARGNPGRPKGARNRATVAAQELLEGEAGALTRKAIELALEGDMAALRLCLERIVPLRRSVPVNFAMPAMSCAADAAKGAAAVIDGVAGGELTPAEGTQLMALIETYRRTLETTEIEERVSALERLGRTAP